MAYKDAEERRKNKRAWYKLNSEKEVQKVIERRKETKAWLQEYKKQLSCERCGMSFSEHPECCDFHHNDAREKEANIAQLVYYSKERILKEIAKCSPLCANCHRIISAEENAWSNSKKAE